MLETDRNYKTELLGDTIISKIIGQKPRKPRSYDMRMVRGSKEDIEVCTTYDKKLKSWDEKAAKIISEEHAKNITEREDAKNFVVKKVAPIIVSVKNIYDDFLEHYKIQNKNKSFNTKNPYSDSSEPKEYIYTLIYYFMKDERFFKSPLLRKDLSAPSFEKGTLTIGGFGCGKSSTFFALLSAFRNHVDYVRKVMPENMQDIIDKYRINQCISTDIVNQHDTVKHKNSINDIMMPLMSSVPLYIDDILREDDAYYQKNIFKKVLTHRADRNSKTHLTMNPSEDDQGKVEDIQKSLLQYKTRYDGRIHDRIFGDYNIIELSGKSFRR